MDSERARALNAPFASERLRFEPLTGAHADECFEPLQHAKIYTWISTGVPSSVEQLREDWKRSENPLSPDGAEAWLAWIVRRSSDGVCIGKLDANVNYEGVATNVGYMFFPAHWGRGYATESVRALAAQLEEQGVLRMYAAVTAGNDASGRVLEKAGFVRTRIIPENDTIRGVKYDDIEYVREIIAR